MNYLIGAWVLVLAMCSSCTSPLDLDTPRDRTAETTHLPLPEGQRVIPASISIKVTESDFPTWSFRTPTSVTITIDTTFHPPLHWISGMLINSDTGFPKRSMREIYFHCDTLAADSVQRTLTGNALRILANRKDGVNVKLDTLNSDEMITSQITSRFHTGVNVITDTIRLHFYGDANSSSPVYGTVVMKVSW